MNKYIYNIALMTTLLIGGCAKEKISDMDGYVAESEGRIVEVSALQPTMPSTRIGVTINPDAEYGEEYISYNWEVTDQIAVLYQRNRTVSPSIFNVKRNTISEDGKSVIFTGEINPSLMLVENGGIGENDGAEDGRFYVAAVAHSSALTTVRNVEHSSFDFSSQITDGEYNPEDALLIATALYDTNFRGGEFVSPLNFEHWSSVLELNLELLSEDGSVNEPIELDQVELTIKAPTLSARRDFNLSKEFVELKVISTPGDIKATVIGAKNKGTAENPLRAIIQMFPPTSNDGLLPELSLELRSTVDGQVAIYNVTIDTGGEDNYIEVGKYYKLTAQLSKQKLVLGDTEDAPIEISTAEQLAQLATEVNAGDSKENKFFAITAPIDLGTIPNWTPIGIYGNPFKGNINGNSHRISNMTIDLTEDIENNRQGLFGVVQGGSFKNIEVDGSISINSTDAPLGDIYIGGIIGEMPINATSTQFSGEFVSEVDITYNNTARTLGSVRVAGLFGVLNADATSVAENTLFTYGAESGTATKISVEVKNRTFLYVGGVAGQMTNLNNSNKKVTTTGVTMTNNANIYSNNIVEGATTELKTYVGGVAGEQTQLFESQIWRAVLGSQCTYIHGVLSPSADSNTSAKRWVCVGGFIGYVNATKKFYSSLATDVPESVKIIAEVSNAEGVITSATPTYRVTVGTFAGTKGVNTGGGNAQAENKVAGAGAVIFRDNNYISLYDGFLTAVGTLGSANANLTGVTYMSHSGQIITSPTSDGNYNEWDGQY